IQPQYSPRSKMQAAHANFLVTAPGASCIPLVKRLIHAERAAGRKEKAMTRKTTSMQTRLTQNLFFSIAFGGLLTAVFCPRVYAQDDRGLSGIAWEHGPVVVRVGDQGTMNLREGFVFTHEAGARTFLELTQNPPSGHELGILAPQD